MKRSINHRENLFKRANLTPIRGEPTFKTIYYLRNEIKYNDKSVYSNIREVTHGRLGLVLTDSKYALIFNRPFVYLSHSAPLIITDRTTAHRNYNMHITHNKSVRILREVTGLEQTIIQ